MTSARQPASTTATTSSAQPAQREGPHLPGDSGMWVFVLGDLVIFSVYFVIFMIHRNREADLFLVSQHHLNPTIAAANTLVLVTSSWFIARGVQAARTGDHARALRLAIATIGCGLLFILLKAIEWALEISRGLTLPSNDFFMFYYMLTGVHLVHVVMGLVIMGVVIRELRVPRLRRVSVVETGATYWHMVDLLWIVIFALVYVMR
ncbi:cytochrome c oxidase subunit 3 family protein [Actinomadura barringtoniae]|uniref:Cytochrome aa3 subunit 3 n=1 Tax=Actinomadura barringtoniae TaxID=1427535 RepID=A0A939P913_9ACTN|nr:cytochrome c oxidase subunit 3 family protein [Actinomadura barringtoniae]MBO2447677.1 cytochrome c oxidase subunit 3 family protein [Actinomadura barringtoniae]